MAKPAELLFVKDYKVKDAEGVEYKAGKVYSGFGPASVERWKRRGLATDDAAAIAAAKRGIAEEQVPVPEKDKPPVAGQDGQPQATGKPPFKAVHQNFGKYSILDADGAVQAEGLSKAEAIERAEALNAAVQQAAAQQSGEKQAGASTSAA